MFQFIPSFVKEGTDYAVPTLEAITMAADVFPPLKSAAGGAYGLQERYRLTDWP